MTWNKFTACSYGAECTPEVIIAKPIQFFLDEVEIEPNVVRYENGIFCNGQYVTGYVSERGRILYHLIRNTGQMTNEWRNWAAWIQ